MGVLTPYSYIKLLVSNQTTYCGLLRVFATTTDLLIIVTGHWPSCVRSALTRSVVGAPLGLEVVVCSDVCVHPPPPLVAATNNRLLLKLTRNTSWTTLFVRTNLSLPCTFQAAILVGCGGCLILFARPRIATTTRKQTTVYMWFCFVVTCFV